MTGFADIHTHILPGADDGATNMQQAMQLLQLAYDSGTRNIVLTPHYRGKYRCNTPQQLKSIFTQLQSQAAQRFLDLQLYLGQEIYYDTAAVEALAEGRAISIADTQYALVEFAPKSTAQQIQKGVDSFLYYGYRTVIAHAERCRALRKRAVLSYVLEKGVLLQLNAHSVLGKNGWAAKRFCAQCLHNRTASFLASDGHNTTVRMPVLDECFNYVSKKYGMDYARRLFMDNPGVLLRNGEL